MQGSSYSVLTLRERDVSENVLRTKDAGGVLGFAKQEQTLLQKSARFNQLLLLVGIKALLIKGLGLPAKRRRGFRISRSHWSAPAKAWLRGCQYNTLIAHCLARPSGSFG